MGASSFWEGFEVYCKKWCMHYSYFLLLNFTLINRITEEYFKMDLDMFNNNVFDLINNNMKKVIAVGVSFSKTNAKVPLSTSKSNVPVTKTQTKVSLLSVLRKNHFVQRSSKLMENALLELTIIASTWYMAYVPLLLIYLSELLLLIFSLLFSARIALR